VLPSGRGAVPTGLIVPARGIWGADLGSVRVGNGDARQARDSLARLLLASPSAEETLIRAHAERIAWRLPERLAVLVGRGPTDVADASWPEEAARRLPPDALVLVRRDAPGDCVVAGLMSLCAGERARLERFLVDRGGLGVIGPEVAWSRLGDSHDRAAALLRLIEAVGADAFARVTGTPSDRRLHRTDDHRLLLMMGGDLRLLGEYVEAVLEPLAELSSSRRAALEQTLEAWLDTPTNMRAVALRLYVHPKTVQYRLKRLRECFGEHLDDPRGRLDIHLAIKFRALAGDADRP
jgi:hypothetical protein